MWSERGSATKIVFLSLNYNTLAVGSVYHSIQTRLRALWAFFRRFCSRECSKRTRNYKSLIYYASI